MRQARATGRAHVTRVSGPSGAVVCETCEMADTFGRRLRGLMFRAELPSGTGVLIRPSGSVHTCFMRFPIDVVFLDRDLRVVRVAESVRPWRGAAARRAKAALELSAGEAARRGIVAGMQLTFTPHDEAHGV